MEIGVQEIEENGKRGAGVGSKFVSFQTFICSGPGILSRANLAFQDEVCFYPQRIHRRGRPFDFWGGYGWFGFGEKFFPQTFGLGMGYV